MKPTIKTLTRTCFLCPEQWEGELSDGRSIYARERHGSVRVEIDDEVIHRSEEGSALDALHFLFEIPIEVLEES